MSDSWFEYDAIEKALTSIGFNFPHSYIYQMANAASEHRIEIQEKLAQREKKIAYLKDVVEGFADRKCWVLHNENDENNLEWVGAMDPIEYANEALQFLGKGVD